MNCYYGLGIKAIVFLLLVIFNGVSCENKNVKDESIFKNKILAARRRIANMKKHAVKSIQSDDGDIFDCVDFYKQPAFDHPALKNHTIQFEPTKDPNAKTTTTSNTNTRTTVKQLWQKNGSCPKGTVPIRRIREEDLLKASSIETYGRKKPEYYHMFNDSKPKTQSNFLHVNQTLSILLTGGYRYSGAMGDISVWNPYVEKDDEYSTSHISLRNGPSRLDFENVEAGWAVNPGLYGDRKTRLFVYYTLDGSRNTGCFDATCPGFVQTNSEIAVGAAVHPGMEVPGGLLGVFTLYMHKDILTGHWWVQYGNDINVGYWPNDLFDYLSYHAATVQWGGEVSSGQIGEVTPHTATAMGNGNTPDRFGNAGCIRRLRVRENDPDLKRPEWASALSEEFDCYRYDYVKEYTDEPFFVFGGPGRSPVCR